MGIAENAIIKQASPRCIEGWVVCDVSRVSTRFESSVGRRKRGFHRRTRSQRIHHLANPILMPPISSESIRNRLIAHLAESGIVVHSPVRETILIRDGYYCGRKYQAEGYTLVWFQEEDQLKLFAPNGSLCWSKTYLHFLTPSATPSTGIQRAA